MLGKAFRYSLLVIVIDALASGRLTHEAVESLATDLISNFCEGVTMSSCVCRKQQEVWQLWKMWKAEKVKKALAGGLRTKFERIRRGQDHLGKLHSAGPVTAWLFCARLQTQ